MYVIFLLFYISYILYIFYNTACGQVTRGDYSSDGSYRPKYDKHPMRHPRDKKELLWDMKIELNEKKSLTFGEVGTSKRHSIPILAENKPKWIPHFIVNCNMKENEENILEVWKIDPSLFSQENIFLD